MDKTREGKHKQSRWERRLLREVYDLEADGHPVRFVTYRVLHDYGGMNFAAAKEMGFPWPRGFSKKGYLISATSVPKTQAKDLWHEHHEYTDMTGPQKLDYWDAHKRALKAEDEIRC